MQEGYVSDTCVIPRESARKMDAIPPLGYCLEKMLLRGFQRGGSVREGNLNNWGSARTGCNISFGVKTL